MSLGYSKPSGGCCDECGRPLAQYVETDDGEFLHLSCYNARAARATADVEVEQ